eukprot:1216381-Prymnesium_polylepis.1
MVTDLASSWPSSRRQSVAPPMRNALPPNSCSSPSGTPPARASACASRPDGRLARLVDREARARAATPPPVDDGDRGVDAQRVGAEGPVVPSRHRARVALLVGVHVLDGHHEQYQPRPPPALRPRHLPHEAAERDDAPRVRLDAVRHAYLAAAQ